MAAPAQLQKAYLEPETGARIECMFNPAKFSFSMANQWESDKVPGKGTPVMRFAGGRRRVVQPEPGVRHHRPGHAGHRPTPTSCSG